MPQPATTKTMPKGRGEGLVYNGSLTQFHGLTVVSMWDCDCEWCDAQNAWDADVRVDVILTDGVRLHHARCSSFIKPEEK